MQKNREPVLSGISGTGPLPIVVFYNGLNMENKTKIILTRRSAWINRFRNYSIFIDDMEVGSIKNGASEEFVVSPGTHHIYCRIAWYGSPVFIAHVEQGRIEYLIVRSAIKYYWPMLLLLFTGMIINLLYSGTHEDRPLQVFILQLSLILPPLLYLLYYLSIGKKEWLLIEEDKDNIFAS